MIDTVTRLLLFGGTGGVGKTTLSAATALYWAGQDARGSPGSSEVVPVPGYHPESPISSRISYGTGRGTGRGSPGSSEVVPVPGRGMGRGSPGSSMGQRKILIASTDPAHSLCDSFDQAIGDVITPIRHVPNLFALEMDAAKRLENFKRKHGSVMKKIMDRDTYFDQEDIAEFFDLSLPGLDELMAVIE
ncbi:MAG: ArsA-related P-loop ATPase, partial [Anaerolineales bacterium]|nr:ArsA-related P-loop ATPase [Anaerolineales bacterium]